jgi:hypothetical protein
MELEKTVTVKERRGGRRDSGVDGGGWMSKFIEGF